MTDLRQIALVTVLQALLNGVREQGLDLDAFCELVINSMVTDTIAGENHIIAAIVELERAADGLIFSL